MTRAMTLTELMLGVALLGSLTVAVLPHVLWTARHHQAAARHVDDLHQATRVADGLAASVREAAQVHSATPDGRWRTDAQTLVLGRRDGGVEVWTFTPGRASAPPSPGRLRRLTTPPQGAPLQEDLGHLWGLVVQLERDGPVDPVRAVTLEVELGPGEPAEALTTRALVGAGEGLR